MRKTLLTLSALSLIGLMSLSPSQAASRSCTNSGSFTAWKSAFQQEARANGISNRAISTLNGIRFDPKIVKHDRRQGVFAQSFLKFSKRMVSSYRLKTGRAKLKRYAPLFRKVERQYGIPGPVIVAFWGLETDFGAFMGKESTLNALTTLAYDCRRPELFRPQLMDALRLIDRGDIAPSQMVGAWAGEIGQMQFMPSDYLHRAVDGDGDGRRDLRRSVPDVIASSANLLKSFGWRAGEPWLREVRVPRKMRWDQADKAIKHPQNHWASWGVTKVNGSPLPNNGRPAALILPMGKDGPAFLAYKNFDIYTDWNKSFVYATTAAYFATRLAGAGPVRKGNGTVTPLTLSETKQLQRKLKRRGFDVGAKTRAAVKAMQLKYGLAADSYPTHRLLDRL